ncbi:hypothetical protein [Arthrobacter sp. RCC_34]|uniref:hypothetical protein n=1 Tax=Arthrobacter sp. RCC_34 TaxID=3239230 RepID=UPI0035245FE1
MEREELPEDGPEDESTPPQLRKRYLISSAALSSIALVLCATAWAALFVNPNGSTSIISVEVPTIAWVASISMVTICVLALFIRELMRKIPESRQKYLPTISFFLSAAVVLTGISLATPLWSRDAGPVLRISGNFAGLSAFAALIFVKLRSVDLSP